MLFTADVGGRDYAIQKTVLASNRNTPPITAHVLTVCYHLLDIDISIY
jgi:hypothetical protein